MNLLLLSVVPKSIGRHWTDCGRSYLFGICQWCARRADSHYSWKQRFRNHRTHTLWVNIRGTHVLLIDNSLTGDSALPPRRRVNWAEDKQRRVTKANHFLHWMHFGNALDICYRWPNDLVLCMSVSHSLRSLRCAGYSRRTPKKAQGKQISRKRIRRDLNHLVGKSFAK
mgnify:FL=1